MSAAYTIQKLMHSSHIITTIMHDYTLFYSMLHCHWDDLGLTFDKNWVQFLAWMVNGAVCGFITVDNSESYKQTMPAYFYLLVI